MRFGSKGLDAPVIIGVIVAVVAAAIILYILWSKGMLPFVSGANEAECTAYFIRSCQSQGQEFKDTIKNTLCNSFTKKFNGYKECFVGLGGTPNCESFCNAVLATS